MRNAFDVLLALSITTLLLYLVSIPPNFAYKNGARA